MLRVVFAGTFAARLEPRVRAHLEIPCDVIVGDELGIVSRLADVDVLVALEFTREMGAAARRLKLVQVPEPDSTVSTERRSPRAPGSRRSTATKSALQSRPWARC